MCRQPVPDGVCCCDRCHAAGWSILFYSGVEVQHFGAEVWLPAWGFEDSYDVSTFGRVRNRRTGRILAASGRYPSVRLGGRTVAVHRLMGETYLGGPWPGQVVCHQDDDPNNLWICNLAYGSRRDNAADAIRHGVRRRWCPSGHRLAGANVFIRSDGVRACSTCVDERAGAARDFSEPTRELDA
ncbi:HNH endonuclease [Mycobacterium sp. M23085]|uniref:HNH endonuclease n=1 Tax=Mycobacterium sp. M23085 TaxID=3378087 RepID=UPI003877E133